MTSSMGKSRLLLLFATLLALFVWFLRPAPEPPPTSKDPSQQAEPAEPPAEAPEGRGRPAGAQGGPGEGETIDAASGDDISAPGSGASARRLSEVPHRVHLAWGRDEQGRSRGAIGYSIVVDPSISNAELARLTKDVIAANEDAEILSVRIYDDEEATSLERHMAHDSFIQDHTVGIVWVNKKMDLRKARVRGELVDLPPAPEPGQAESP